VAIDSNVFLHYLRMPEVIAMATLSVTARGQVTFRKDVMKHLGIQPGGKIRVDLLPDGRAELRADRPDGSWDEMRNFFAGKTNGARLSIDDINDAIAQAGAAAGMAGLDKP
jgi:bifunctional DNA-binding transcriptional regulator/antitoxin component of YhaV-PrlF toxin-antitoxin module